MSGGPETSARTALRGAGPGRPPHRGAALHTLTAPDPDQWHALDAPFTTWERWQPVPGTCSRCHQSAEHGLTRWWHVGTPCPSRGRPADFVPDAVA